ncbi:MAG: hypothetical protein ACE5WD_01065 [Candidatus Aminicenantia bacterium]
MKRNLIFIFLILGLTLFFLWYSSPEQKIKRSLTDLRKSVEKEKESKVLDKIASFFKYYQYDKNDIARDCEMFFNSYDRIRIEIKDINIKVKKKKGVSSFRLKVLARYGGYFFILVGGRREFEEVEFYWKKENGKWKIFTCSFPTLRKWISIRPKKQREKKYIKI